MSDLLGLEMDLDDKILVLLASNDQGKDHIESERLCLLLGRDWEELRERIGLMRVSGWIYSWETYTPNRVLIRCFAISENGKAELKKRIEMAQEKKR
jgi:hypothetical protein